MQGKNINESGAKYLKTIVLQGSVNYVGKVNYGQVDVYAVLKAFNVTCPARQHAIKKLLCAGEREKGSIMQDLKEAKDAIVRACEIERSGTDILHADKLGKGTLI